MGMKVLESLKDAGATYEVIDCDPSFADTAEFCNHYGYSLDESANAILLEGKAESPVYALCVVLATTRINVNKVARKRLGTRKASFASAEITKELTGMEIGGVTPVGLPEDLPVWIDSLVMEAPKVIIGAGSRSAKIYLSPDNLLRFPNTHIVDGLSMPIVN
jgi:prolyl-tRNA editing enzyme YbaK/EbsC (Cys-tRNA(Pro) deacylase)|tara:strand:- start:151 stop:636 length:486 start_codon:yes stop_codon:yes gene_type:complete